MVSKIDHRDGENTGIRPATRRNPILAEVICWPIFCDCACDDGGELGARLPAFPWPMTTFLGA